MTTLLDSRTSQNASYANSIAIPILTVNTPQLVGQIGLNVSQAADTDLVATQFTGTVSLQLPLSVVGITITVVRGTSYTDPLVYSATSTFNLSVLAPQVISITGSDYDVEIGAVEEDLLVYTMFVESNLLGAIRVGPESFNAGAYILG
ncbi:TPA: hypothetical protein ACGXQD_005784 [Bacillus cereus]|nr:hypothetical protein [Bacillus cereus]MDA1769696.1 hypothetical protein [Bacillus cereus]